MSRFILNLRNTTSSSGELGMTSTPPSVYTDIDFTTSGSGVLGNIGASVMFTGDEEGDEDDVE